MPRKKKKEPKHRNPLHNHPLLRKCGKHSKMRKRDKINQDRKE